MPTEIQSASGNGDLCTQGYYCAEGTGSDATSTKCATGTFGAGAGLSTAEECSSCPAGYYCPDTAQTTFTVKCPAGSYCISGLSAIADE